MSIPHISPRASTTSVLPCPTFAHCIIEKIARCAKAIFELLSSLFHSLFCCRERPVAALTARQDVAAPTLLSFYRGEAALPSGATFEEILSWDNERLERQHDYIQWLFPTQRPSVHNSQAPLLTRELQQTFTNDPALLNKVERAFVRMLSFYGFERREDNLSLRPAPNFEERLQAWVKIGSHNYLRITRILTSLNLMGLHIDATLFHQALCRHILSQEGRKIGPRTRHAWGNAAHNI